MVKERTEIYREKDGTEYKWTKRGKYEFITEYVPAAPKPEPKKLTEKEIKKLQARRAALLKTGLLSAKPSKTAKKTTKNKKR